ncbi:MAG: hypothetical protein MRY64_15180 [Hyphomonadaceae bacterium]|nr:hypothetical protein [Hyphomonadaceae bacterium]
MHQISSFPQTGPKGRLVYVFFVDDEKDRPMVIAYAIATLLLVLAGLLVFAWPIVWAGPGHRLRALGGPEMRFLGGTVATVALMAVLAPLASVSITSGGAAFSQTVATAQAISFDL